MKIIDRYLLKSFLVTFATVFVILFFIFILQTVWLYISELAGKDLGFVMITKFLIFAMPKIVPLVLPLSVLLASIMTFGGLSENYEFAAMKSAGISLKRTMYSLTVFIVLLSIVSFFFANNVIPYAEYKFINFRRNIAQLSPAMAIAEGQFSEIGTYTIKVGKKSGEKGNHLTDVLIHIKSPTEGGVKTVIQAKRGELISSESSNILKLILFDGFYYEDITPKRYEERQRLPFAKASFKKDIINIDLSKLNKESESGEITNTNNMLNISELKYTLDSLTTNYKKDIKSYAENIYQRVNNATGYPRYANSGAKVTDINTHIASLPTGTQAMVFNVAKNNAESTIFTIDSSKFEMEEKQKNINLHWIALYEKFVIAFSCILMFFIGAPLGAIIRKGGLGLPIVFAVGIFIVFHFINTFGKKVAQENGITPFLGTWMSTFVLAPLAVFLTYRAMNDIGGMMIFENITNPFRKLFPTKEDATPEDDHEAKEIAKRVEENHVEIPNKETYEIKPNAVANTTLYHKEAKVALVLNFLSVGLFAVTQNNPSIIILDIVQVILTGALLYFTYRAQKAIQQIATTNSTVIEPGIGVGVVTAFPFFFLLHLYNCKELKKINSQQK